MSLEIVSILDKNGKAQKGKDPNLPPEELKAWMDQVCAAIDEWRAHPNEAPLVQLRLMREALAVGGTP